MLMVSNAGAGRGFIHERTMVVPGLSSPVRNMKFADIDKDGIPELLASDSSRIVLYSISQDKSIFSRTVDSGYTIGSIELADVNRDSVIDVAIASFVVTQPSIPGLVINRLDVYDGRSMFARHDSAIYSSVSDRWRPPFMAAVDINSDGLNELLFAYDTTSIWGTYWMFEYTTEGRTFLYRSFPASISASSYRRIVDFRLTLLTPGGTITLGEIVSSGRNDGGPVPQYDNRYASLAAIDSSLKSSQVATHDSSQWCNAHYWNDYSNKMDCFGKVSLRGEGNELLTTYSYSFGCWQESLFTTTARLNLWELTSPTSAQLIWSKDITGTSYHDFVFMPQLPGYFFAFAGDTLVMFNGNDGSIRRTLADTPVGTKHWDTTFPDKEPRLIVTRSHTIDIYRLDIAVDVPETTIGHLLLSSFTLGVPYPNPFNAQMSIPVKVGHRGRLDIVVYNLLGEAVATLFDGEVELGEHRYNWDATRHASGFYFIRVSFEGKSLTAKALLLK